jgi:hypothetical protein
VGDACLRASYGKWSRRMGSRFYLEAMEADYIILGYVWAWATSLAFPSIRRLISPLAFDSIRDFHVLSQLWEED